MQKRRNELGVLAGLILVICLLSLALWQVGPAVAEGSNPAAEKPANETQIKDASMLFAQGQEPTHPASDLACRLCHSDSTSMIEFPSGESLPVDVDLQVLDMSAHGSGSDEPLVCTDCHEPADYQFPHEPVKESDLRSFELARSANCERCHEQPHLTSHPGPESDNPVVCTDCHGSHDVLTVEQWQTGQGTEACIECHTETGIDLIDPVQLGEIVRGGMFADRVNNDYCLACHSQPDFTLTFENGDEKSLYVDGNALHNSVHGADNPWQPLACTDCHGRNVYPHAKVEATSAREYTLASNQRCQKCHEGNFEKALDSVHGAALEEGNLEAAMCTDCHGAHDTPQPDVPRERISHTCQKCHSAIFDTYAGSVHGEALL